MILLAILLIIGVVLIAVGAIGLISVGAAFITTFGDVIVAVALLVILIKHIIKKHSK